MPAHRFILSLLCVLSLLWPGLSVAKAEERLVVKKLKNLYLTTNLVEKGAARAVIIAPAGEHYAAEVNLIQQQIQRLTGVTLPVYRDEKPSEELLRGQNVIAVGNMATNPFIESLYRQWQVILDLKYPGQGGYTVRSLHNPYGTGHNAIFIGGSDDEGVKAATDIFLKDLKPGKNLSVGRLMNIKLGTGMSPPTINAYMQKWNVQSWSDSRRMMIDGTITGYDPSTFFGWNPISIAGALYYLTGREEYLKTFREIALPDPSHLPLPNRTSDAFTDPANPLVKNYHYRSHLVDRFYDLMEESPLITDSERLQITNKLMEHQYDLDPGHTFSTPNGDRHSLWHMISIYTGSRYFSTYYPDPVWQRRLDNVRKGFQSVINNPTWGERDTLEWVSTSIEPIFEFFLLDGANEFVKSGTARSYMQGLEVLFTGEEVDDFNRFLPLNLLYKAAHLLKDNRFSWLADQLGADTGVFRIGQSYWPKDSAEASPPNDLVGKITAVPLAKNDRKLSGSAVPANESFQLISYRTGLKASDDYLQLDGFEGLGRHPYQVNTLSRLRMFGGRNFLSGYANDLSIWRNGMTGPLVARSAALKQRLATTNTAFVLSTVPDMPGSSWERRILYLRDKLTLVLDRVVPGEAGSFDIVTSWQMGGGIKWGGKPSRSFQSSNGTALMSADLTLQNRSGSIVQGMLSRNLKPGESVTLATLFFNSASPKTVTPLRRGGYLVNGTHSAFVANAPVSMAGLSIQAEFSYFDKEKLLLAGTTELLLDGKILFSSDKPVCLLWNLQDGSVVVTAAETAQVRLMSKQIVATSDDQTVLLVLAPKELAGNIAEMLKILEKERVLPETATATAMNVAANWKPLWELNLKQKITAFAAGEDGALWVASQGPQAVTLTQVAVDGKPLTSMFRKGELLSLWAAKGEQQSRAFSLLAGFKDDMLRAFDGDGKELWSVKATIHPSFIVGDRYDAPWFTDPKPPNNMAGVYSLLVGDLWGSGREMIALGRPSTVEFYSLDGRFNNRVATRWGTNTLLATMNAVQGPLVLVGKGYAGIPSVSGITSNFQNVSDGLFHDSRTPGFPNMHAWLQRGMSGMKVVDIDGDGKEEIVYTLSGHWNELRVYDNAGKPLWMKFFGPDKLPGGALFMSTLAVADLDGSGRKSVVVGTRNGWVNAFDAHGNLLWQQRFASAITALSSNDMNHRVAVGCEDGSIQLFDGTGKTLAQGHMKGAVQQLSFTEGALLAGSATGLVQSYPVAVFD